MTQFYAFIDIETTGLDPQKNFITEIAVVKTDADGNEVGTFDALVALPSGEFVPPFIEKLTGITDEMLMERGVHIGNALEMFSNFLGPDTTVVAQFAPFDLSFLEQFGHFEKFYCTRTMSYELDPTAPAKLDDIANRYGVKRTIKHRAMSDAQTARAVFFKMRDLMEPEAFAGLENVVGTSKQRQVGYTPKSTVEVREY